MISGTDNGKQKACRKRLVAKENQHKTCAEKGSQQQKEINIKSALEKRDQKTTEIKMGIKLAICDDDKEVCNSVNHIVEKLLHQTEIQAEISTFNTGKDLCKKMEKVKYDLIFLDIEIPEMNGVEIGKYIREKLQDNTTQIVYISSKKSYAMELFENRHFHFLNKPLTEKDIKKVLDNYLSVYGDNELFFTYKKKMDVYNIELSKIIYFERLKRKIVVKTTEGQDEFYGSLEDIHKELKSDNFFFIHKSYLINVSFVKVFKYDRMVMADDAELPISQSRRKKIREQFLKMEN